MRYSRASALACVGLTLCLLSCEKQAAPPPPHPSPSPAIGTPSQPYVHIESVAPSSFPLSDSDVSIDEVTVLYTVYGFPADDPVRLELYNSVTGVIARTDVPMQQHGQFRWKVGKTALIGPTIRVRAGCPTATTEWAVLGLMHQAPSNVVPRIENVTPNPIYDRVNSSGPIPLTLWGEGFAQGCTAEAKVGNGFPIEMTATAAGSKQLYATLDTEELRDKPISERYIQVKLIVQPQKGTAREDVAWIEVADQ